MKPLHHLSGRQLRLGLLLLITLVFLAACSAAGDETTDNDNASSMDESNMNEMDHDMDENHEDEDMDHQEDHQEHEHMDGEEHHDAEDRIPNNGASILILGPQDGAAFSVGEEVVVEVEVEDFELGVDGRHWHVYVDGTSWGMVMGGNTDQALRGLEEGEHQVEVVLAGGDHLELEDGDTITITVE